LQQVDLFKGIQLENLLPIAHNIVSKKFKLGQLLLKAGEIPEGLIIIKSGYCKVGLD
jgi:CRP-like cAMP-binding protein